MYLIKIFSKKEYLKSLTEGKTALSIVQYFRENTKGGIAKVLDPYEGTWSTYHEDTVKQPISNINIESETRSNVNEQHINVLETMTISDFCLIEKVTDGFFYISCWGLLSVSEDNLIKETKKYLIDNTSEIGEFYFVVCTLKSVIESFTKHETLKYHGEVDYDLKGNSNYFPERPLLLFKTKEYEEQREYRFVLDNPNRCVGLKILDLNQLDIIHEGVIQNTLTSLMTISR